MNLDEQPAVAQGRQSESFATPADDDQMPETAAPPLPSAEGFSADLPPPEPLSAAAAKESHGMEEVVGEYTVLCLFSKNWVLRDAALQKVFRPTLHRRGGSAGARLDAQYRVVALDSLLNHALVRGHFTAYNPCVCPGRRVVASWLAASQPP